METARDKMVRAHSHPMAWSPANNGGGKRMWFLVRHESVPIDERYREASNGNLIRYASFETALEAADNLNRKAGL